MHPSVKPVAQQIRVNYKLVTDTFGILTHFIALRRFTVNTNCSNWLLGHLVTNRQVMAGLAGVMIETERWNSLYGRGCAFNKTEEYPSLEEIQQAWTQVSELLNSALSGLTQKDLDIKCPFSFPVDDKTTLGGLAFLALHESYHVGQLGIIRKEMGLPTFFD